MGDLCLWKTNDIKKCNRQRTSGVTLLFVRPRGLTGSGLKRNLSDVDPGVVHIVRHNDNVSEMLEWRIYMIQGSRSHTRESRQYSWWIVFYSRSWTWWTVEACVSIDPKSNSLDWKHWSSNTLFTQNRIYQLPKSCLQSLFCRFWSTACCQHSGAWPQ